MNEIFEFVFRVVAELILELMFRGPGYLILRLCGVTPAGDPQGCLAIVCGGVFWLCVGLLIWAIVSWL